MSLSAASGYSSRYDSHQLQSIQVQIERQRRFTQELLEEEERNAELTALKAAAMREQLRALIAAESAKGGQNKGIYSISPSESESITQRPLGATTLSSQREDSTAIDGEGDDSSSTSASEERGRGSLGRKASSKGVLVSPPPAMEKSDSHALSKKGEAEQQQQRSSAVTTGLVETPPISRSASVVGEGVVPTTNDRIRRASSSLISPNVGDEEEGEVMRLHTREVSPSSRRISPLRDDDEKEQQAAAKVSSSTDGRRVENDLTPELLGNRKGQRPLSNDERRNSPGRPRWWGSPDAETEDCLTPPQAEGGSRPLSDTEDSELQSAIQEADRLRAEILFSKKSLTHHPKAETPEREYGKPIRLPQYAPSSLVGPQAVFSTTPRGKGEDIVDEIVKGIERDREERHQQKKAQLEQSQRQEEEEAKRQTDQAAAASSLLRRSPERRKGPLVPSPSRDEEEEQQLVPEVNDEDVNQPFRTEEDEAGVLQSSSSSMTSDDEEQEETSEIGEDEEEEDDSATGRPPPDESSVSRYSIASDALSHATVSVAGSIAATTGAHHEGVTNGERIRDVKKLAAVASNKIQDELPEIVISPEAVVNRLFVLELPDGSHINELPNTVASATATSTAQQRDDGAEEHPLESCSRTADAATQPPSPQAVNSSAADSGLSPDLLRFIVVSNLESEEFHYRSLIDSDYCLVASSHLAFFETLEATVQRVRFEDAALHRAEEQERQQVIRQREDEFISMMQQHADGVKFNLLIQTAMQRENRMRRSQGGGGRASTSSVDGGRGRTSTSSAPGSRQASPSPGRKPIRPLLGSDINNKLGGTRGRQSTGNSAATRSGNSGLESPTSSVTSPSRSTATTATATTTGNHQSSAAASNGSAASAQTTSSTTGGGGGKPLSIGSIGMLGIARTKFMQGLKKDIGGADLSSPNNSGSPRAVRVDEKDSSSAKKKSKTYDAVQTQETIDNVARPINSGATSATRYALTRDEELGREELERQETTSSKTIEANFVIEKRRLRMNRVQTPPAEGDNNSLIIDSNGTQAAGGRAGGRENSSSLDTSFVSAMDPSSRPSSSYFSQPTESQGGGGRLSSSSTSRLNKGSPTVVVPAEKRQLFSEEPLHPAHERDPRSAAEIVHDILGIRHSSSSTNPINKSSHRSNSVLREEGEGEDDLSWGPAPSDVTHEQEISTTIPAAQSDQSRASQYHRAAMIRSRVGAAIEGDLGAGNSKPSAPAANRHRYDLPVESAAPSSSSDSLLDSSSVSRPGSSKFKATHTSASALTKLEMLARADSSRPSSAAGSISSGNSCGEASPSSTSGRLGSPNHSGGGGGSGDHSSPSPTKKKEKNIIANSNDRNSSPSPSVAGRGSSVASTTSSSSSSRILGHAEGGIGHLGLRTRQDNELSSMKVQLASAQAKLHKYQA